MSSLLRNSTLETVFRPFPIIWIQEGFTAERPRHDSGATFRGSDSGFGPNVSQSYRPKVGVTDQKPGRPPESEPNRPDKEPEWRLGASAENPP